MPQRAPDDVLLIEDDAILSLWIEEALIETGSASVRHCTSTEMAMAALRSQTPDLIILDVHLADRDDGWAIAELVDMLGTIKPRIVFSTGSPEEIPETIARMGTVLEKPYSRDEFVAATRIGRQRGGGLLKGLGKSRS